MLNHKFLIKTYRKDLGKSLWGYLESGAEKDTSDIPINFVDLEDKEDWTFEDNASSSICNLHTYKKGDNVYVDITSNTLQDAKDFLTSARLQFEVISSNQRLMEI